MIPRQFPAMVLAEIRIVFGRATGLVSLALAVVVGLGAVAALQFVKTQGAEAQLNGLPLDSIVSANADTALAWALRARNFYVLPMMLLLSAAGSLGGELQDHTLREALVRPVSRVSVVLAKLLALAVLALSTLVLTFVPAWLGGALLFGAGPDPAQVALGYLATWMSDVGLLTMALLVASILRSVGGTVVAVVMFLMADLVLRLGLGLVGALGLESANGVKEALPGAALAAWEGYQEGFSWNPFLGLLGLIVFCLAGTLLRVGRTDVP